MEVSPLLANDTKTTIDAALRIHKQADRPNLYVKIPGTPAGVPAIEAAIFAGVPVNVTLLFSREHYLSVAEAYMRGIERRIAAGLDPRINSVASLFVSRWDRAVADKVPAELRNRLGIAIAARTYRAHCELARGQALAGSGGRRRAQAAHVVGQHRNQGPEGAGRPVRRGPRGSRHHRHHAREDLAGIRCRRQASSPSWRRTAAMPSRCWRDLRQGRHRRRRARRPPADGRGGILRQILDRAHEAHRRQKRGTGNAS